MNSGGMCDGSSSRYQFSLTREVLLIPWVKNVMWKKPRDKIIYFHYAQMMGEELSKYRGLDVSVVCTQKEIGGRGGTT